MQDHAGRPLGSDDPGPDAAQNDAPLDAAGQSLADALRASFWVLKVIMVVVVACFLVSGAFVVDEKEVAVVTHFGSPSGGPRRPGLHWAWPYPIDDVIRVATSPKTIRIEDFWLRLREDEKALSRDQLAPRGQGLDPAMEGALLTADKAIMHVSFVVNYRVPEANARDYVHNVRDEEKLIRSIIRQAAVAEAARTTAEVIWLERGALADAVRVRGQRQLEALNTGIQIEAVVAEESHYPLQAASEFLAVNNAENRRRALINEAQSERQKTLNGIAGPIWVKINAEIEKLDQVKDEVEREAIIKRIGELLADREVSGESGGLIKLAQRDREGIVNETRAEVSQFEALREEYRRNPELVRLRLGQMMRDELFAHQGVAKWVLPPDDKQVTLWLNKDPKEVAAQQRAEMERTRKEKEKAAGGG